MFPRGRWGALAILLASAPGLVVATPAVAAGAKRPVAVRQPPPPPPGWVVPKVRFEPLTPGSIVGVDGFGDYRGAIEITPAGGGLDVVNEVGLEDYVRGIAEVPSTWPAESLKAQAIAARTYALHQLLAVPDAYKAGGFQICGSDSCQVYAGLAKERAPAGDAWVAAVTATAGQVVLYRGLPILAKYSASNGGRTVAGGQPYLRAVDDPDDARFAQHQWHLTFPLDQIRAAFALPGTVFTATKVGDAVALAWQADDGSTGETLIPLADFRSRLNAVFQPQAGLPQTVPSPLFDVTADPAGGVLVVDGRGYGHGIGLSQYGALGKALRGMRAADILASYYAGLRPVQLPPQQLPPTIRVGLGTGRPAATVVGSAQFRILDAAGATVAVAAAGRWQVVPVPGGVRIVPPAGQDAVPTIDHVAVAPGPLFPGSHPRLQFRLDHTPSLVTIAIADSTGLPPVTLDPMLVQPGDTVRPLPTLRATGPYTVTITADAGGGRVATVPVSLVVADPPPVRLKVASAVRGPAHRGGLLALALAGVAVSALVAAGAAVARAGRATGRVH